MTKAEAQQAMEDRTEVESGAGEDHDTGRIISIDGDMATVSWDSGVRTPCPISDLRAPHSSPWPLLHGTGPVCR